MKTMKRLLALAMVLAVALCLMACGGNDATTAPATTAAIRIAAIIMLIIFFLAIKSLLLLVDICYHIFYNVSSVLRAHSYFAVAFFPCV